jgi:phage FluMu protein Com
MRNCNECEYISITEEAQHKQSVSIPHICTKFNVEVIHGNNHVGIDDFIEPCRQCKGDLSIDVYCQGTKKKGMPCRRYLGKVEGKAELLCPICKTVNVVENGKVTIKIKDKTEGPHGNVNSKSM